MSSARASTLRMRWEGELRHMSCTLTDKSAHTPSVLQQSSLHHSPWQMFGADWVWGGKWLRPLRCHGRNSEGSVPVQSHQLLHPTPPHASTPFSAHCTVIHGASIYLKWFDDGKRRGGAVQRVFVTYCSDISVWRRINWTLRNHSHH